ncbi:hypothetical protein T440DRAFT_480804 [Plenodomus tracheiphilus IPT5]|uniref:Uncharacterized protein n=1 Tax=Plenodomus tracheiphilus IPT5 TaxID=1408161 RepID=A0A6A7B287_9PLEO|nr:hypothetical protein T440DRAFT_480804 [Plenodomus tracheiphilus IPT5]
MTPGSCRQAEQVGKYLGLSRNYPSPCPNSQDGRWPKYSKSADLIALPLRAGNSGFCSTALCWCCLFARASKTPSMETAVRHFPWTLAGFECANGSLDPDHATQRPFNAVTYTLPQLPDHVGTAKVSTRAAAGVTFLSSGAPVNACVLWLSPQLQAPYNAMEYLALHLRHFAFSQLELSLTTSWRHFLVVSPPYWGGLCALKVRRSIKDGSDPPPHPPPTPTTPHFLKPWSWSSTYFQSFRKQGKPSVSSDYIPGGSLSSAPAGGGYQSSFSGTHNQHQSRQQCRDWRAAS